MLPIDKERIARDLATLGERGRAAAEAGFLRWREEHPTKPCTHCAGHGNYTERAGTRRPFDHRDFDRELGDRYEASCPVCRGGGKIAITKEEAHRLERRAIKKARATYRTLRRAVCIDRELEPDHFDRLAKKHLPPGTEKNPQAWLNAAREVAVYFGVAT